MQRILSFFSYGSLLIPCVACSLMAGTLALLDQPSGYGVMLLGAAGAFVLYHGERAWLDAPEDAYTHPERLRWVARHPHYRRWALIASVGVLLVALGYVKTPTRLLAGGLGLLGLLQVAPILPGRERLKAWWAAKPIIIAAGWSLGGVLLVAVEVGYPMDKTLGLLLAYRFFYLLPNALLADERDRTGDARVGLQTMSTRWSRRRIRWLATGAIALALVAGGAMALTEGAGEAGRVLVWVDLVGLVPMLALVWSGERESRRQHPLLLDGLVLWPAVTALVAGV